MGISTPEFLNSLTSDEKVELAQLLEEQANRVKYNKIKSYFPETGPVRRALYSKHMELFRAGKIHRERLFMAANRVGKTESGGGYEIALHLTGEYPEWWEGRRFDRPVEVLAAGDTGESTRDIIQNKMLGGLWDTEEWGSALIPRRLLLEKPIAKQGITGAYGLVKVKHISGGYSTFKLRSYDQGRRIFQGVELDIFWPDEEVPLDVYEEGLIRTMTTQGMVIMTFTPLNGLTPLVMSFMESMNEQDPL